VGGDGSPGPAGKRDQAGGGGTARAAPGASGRNGAIQGRRRAGGGPSETGKPGGEPGRPSRGGRSAFVIRTAARGVGVRGAPPRAAGRPVGGAKGLGASPRPAGRIHN